MPAIGKILKTLMSEANVTESELARNTGLGQPVVHRLASDQTLNPKIDTLSPIAHFFSLTISQLIGDDPLPNNRISKLENSRCKTWKRLPILNWDQIENWVEDNAYRKTMSSQLTEWLLSDITLSQSAYALRTVDQSMLPTFPADALLIVEPKLKPKHNDYVVVYLNKEIVLKKMVMAGKHVYFKSDNPDFSPISLSHNNYTSYGIVMQVRMDFALKH